MPSRKNGKKALRAITLPNGSKYPVRFHLAKAKFEQQLVRTLLSYYDGNVSETAKHMRISRRSLQFKIQKHEINIKKIRRRAVRRDESTRAVVRS